MPEAVIYTRVSSSPKTRNDRKARVGNGAYVSKSLSLEAQLSVCREHARRKNYEVMGEFSDEALSGKDDIDRRPGLQAVLERAAKREDVVVVVYALSRLSRRQSLTWRLLDSKGEYRLALESATEPFDTSSPMGRAMLGMLGVWAQLEADMTSERTVAALEARRARGLHVGPRPLVAERPEIVREIRKLYDEGDFTLATLAEYLNTQGIPTKRGKRWHATQVGRTLRQVWQQSSDEVPHDV